MATHNAPTQELRFRLTRAWPGDPLPIPDVVRAPARLLPAGRIRYSWDERGDVELPDELAIRELLQVDLSEPNEVVGFVNAYGAISQTAGESELLKYIDTPVGERVDTVHVADVAMHLMEVRALARHLLARRKGTNVCDAWADYVPQANEESAEAAFVHCLNNGLRWYSVRVEAQLSYAGRTREFEPRRPGLYSALCLQLYNLFVSDDEVPKSCPSCGIDFYRQRGRSTHGQNRATGVTYCSKLCADRMAARASRQRKREAKEATK